MGSADGRAWRIALLVVAAAVVGATGGFVVETLRSRPPSRDSADVGFLQDMIDHHEQAILISSIALRSELSPPVRTIAVDVVATQRYEVGVMDGWLQRWEHGRGAVRRTAMAWMGHPVSVAEMEGMATDAELARLTAASGPELEAMFFDLMTRHHEGGIAMSDEAATAAGEQDVRSLARRMARNQRREVREMESARLRIEEERAGAPGGTFH